MRWSALWVALAIAIAGCSDDAAGSDEGDDPFDDFDDEPLDEGKGVIRGVVLDPTITPIAGADVRIASEDLSTATNQDGAFFFSDLDPGSYFLSVSKPGYGSVQTSADVEAGVKKPDILKIQIVADPSSEPRAQTFVDTGIIKCGWGVPITYGYCGEETMLGEDDYRLQYEVFGKPDYVQVEVVWESNQPASGNLYMINAICPAANRDSCPGAISAGERWGEGTYTNPAVMRTPDNFTHNAGIDTGWWVGVDVSADGPALATGVTIDQKFDGYVTMFWNIDPDDDWTFFEDGAYEA